MRQNTKCVCSFELKSIHNEKIKQTIFLLIQRLAAELQQACGDKSVSDLQHCWVLISWVSQCDSVL